MILSRRNHVEFAHDVLWNMATCRLKFIFARCLRSADISNSKKPRLYTTIRHRDVLSISVISYLFFTVSWVIWVSEDLMYKKGAMTIFLSTLFWNIWVIMMLLFAECHTGLTNTEVFVFSLFQRRIYLM